MKGKTKLEIKHTFTHQMNAFWKAITHQIVVYFVVCCRRLVVGIWHAKNVEPKQMKLKISKSFDHFITVMLTAKKEKLVQNT